MVGLGGFLCDMLMPWVILESHFEFFLTSDSQAPHLLLLRSHMSSPHPPLHNKDHVLWKINLIDDSYRTYLWVGGRSGVLRFGEG